MTDRSILRALLLRAAIYRTLSVEERCLVALDQFQAALNTLLPGIAESGSQSARPRKVKAAPQVGERRSQPR